MPLPTRVYRPHIWAEGELKRSSKLKTSACGYCLSAFLRLCCNQDEFECQHVQDLVLIGHRLWWTKDLHSACCAMLVHSLPEARVLQQLKQYK